MLHLSLTDAPVLLGLHLRRGGDLLVLRRLDAGRHHRRLPGRRVHQEEHGPRQERGRHRGLQHRRAHLHRSTPRSGMWNIFIALMTITLAFAFFDPNFFVAYLISIAVFGLFQAIYMANAGGAWDNAKKLVEVDLKEKGTPLHAATVDRRHRRRSVQGHHLGGAEPDHQVLDAVRPAGGRDRGQDQASRRRGHGPRITRPTSASSCWRSRWCSCGARSTPCGFRKRFEGCAAQLAPGH